MFYYIIAYSSFSDIRLKKDIEYLDQKECLDKILKLDGVNFTWINPEQPQDRQVGFIAQETEKIILETAPIKMLKPKSKNNRIIDKPIEPNSPSPIRSIPL